MEINTTAHYGLMAAACIAKDSDGGPVLASKIAEDYNIPLEYLFKILQHMVRANILRSKRGRKGGFTLARPAREINLFEIIVAAGGPLSSQLELAQITKKAPFSIEMEKVFTKASDKAESLLSKAKLSQMIK